MKTAPHKICLTFGRPVHRSLASWSRALLCASLALGCQKNPTEGKEQAQASAPIAEVTNGAPQGALVLPISQDSGAVRFVGAKVSATHEGEFKTWSGKIYLVDADPEKSKVEVAIDIKSLSIEPERLKGHLLSPDFFAAEEFPQAKFSSSTIRREGERFSVTGNLELHGVKKAITFPATISIAADQVTVRAEFGINRKDFGIVYPGKPDDLIKDDVLLDLELNAKKTSAK